MDIPTTSYVEKKYPPIDPHSQTRKRKINNNKKRKIRFGHENQLLEVELESYCLIEIIYLSMAKLLVSRELFLYNTCARLFFLTFKRKYLLMKLIYIAVVS